MLGGLGGGNSIIYNKLGGLGGLGGAGFGAPGSSGAGTNVARKIIVKNSSWI